LNTTVLKSACIQQFNCGPWSSCVTASSANREGFRPRVEQRSHDVGLQHAASTRERRLSLLECLCTFHWATPWRISSYVLDIWRCLAFW
jgi:hypothetical protein